MCRATALASSIAIAMLLSCGGNSPRTETVSGGEGGSGGPADPVLTTVRGLLLPDEGDGAGTGDNSSGSGSGASGPCVNLQCQQVKCVDGASTTLTGTVFTPSGELPLYNVTVYVPNKELDPIVDGASCSTCDASVSGSPVVAGITDTAGHFRLENVPTGDDIPLVMQVGKWRRKVTLPRVEPCTENTVRDVNLTRLPANQSEGD